MYFIMWHSGQTFLFWASFGEQKWTPFDRLRGNSSMAKYRPSKNQSQRLDLPQGYLATQQVESQNDRAEAMILNYSLDSKCYDNLG